MKRICLPVFIILLLVTAQFGWSENSTTSAGIMEICEKFLEEIGDGRYNDAFSYIKTYPHSIGEQEFSELEISTIQQSPTIRNLYGRVLDIRLIKEEYGSNVVMKLVYVVVREYIPIRWEFVYYKPAKNWLLVSILFDDDMEKLL